jgi:hypothetical protein
MADFSILKGFRTSCAYFVENTYGTPLISSTLCRKVAGKVRGINWTARQNIIQTGNVGDGRNYKQQLFGNYDASASMNWEVGDFSFLRFGVGDIAKEGAGDEVAAPYYLMNAELTGTDAATLLTAADPGTMTKIRIRPFSMILYDAEQAASGTALVDTVDILKGCMINDFSLSASIGTPLTCSTNLIVKEISHKRNITASATEMPDFTSTVTSASDVGNADVASLTPLISLSYADEAPLMFYNGLVSIDENNLAQVTSFNYSWNNQFVVYRVAGSRFIEMPATGMRRQTLSCNVIFRIESTTDLAQGIPTGSVTNILELIKNYLGYASTSAVTTTTELRPALALTYGGFGGSATGGPAVNVPIEKGYVSLQFDSVGCSFVTGKTTKGAKIVVNLAAVEGFGTPIQLENGLVEIPVTFSVRGYTHKRTGDGSFTGWDGSGSTFATFFATGGPTFSWWYHA